MASASGLEPTALPPHQRERRDRIVGAAIELLEGGEYDGVQIRDVAERAGVALGTLYRYFTSKEHLYAAALLAWSADYPGGAAPSAGSDEQRLRRLMRRAVRAFERRPQMLRAEIALERSQDPNARALFDQFAARNMAAVSAALRDVPPAEAAAVVETVNAVLATRLRFWALGRCSIADVDRSVQRAIDLIFSPPPG